MLKQHFLFALDLFVDCFECFLWHPISWFSNLKLPKCTLLTFNNLFFAITAIPHSFDYAILHKQSHVRSNQNEMKSIYIASWSISTKLIAMARNICYRELKNIYCCQRRHNVSNMTNLLANDMICRKCKIHFLWKNILCKITFTLEK